MSLILNDDHRLLKESVSRFVRDKSPVSALRALRDNQGRDGFDRKLWHEMAALGWAGLLIPEAYGGSGFGHMGLGVVLEETGRALVASPLVSTGLTGASAIVSMATEKQKQTLLPLITRGEHITALAVEEGTRHAPYHIATTAKKTGDGFILNGVKRFVLDGHVADTLMVVARTDEGSHDRDGLSIFLVDPNSPGVNKVRTRMVDSRNAANIEFVDVALPGDAVLGGARAMGTAGDALEQVLDVARIGLAAEMLGGIGETFERILTYLKLREQFGVKIGSFQSLKHRAGIMFTELELATSTVRAALSALDEQSPDVALLASLSKAKTSEVFFLISNEGIQMFGGIGMTDEEEIGFFLKRARVAQQTFGDDRYHRDRYARLCDF